MQTNKGLALATLVSVLLVACNGRVAEDKTAVQVAALTPGGDIRTLGFELESETQNKTLGLKRTTRSGLKTAYRFDASDITVRVDMPGAMFPDKEDRIGTFSKSKPQLKVFLARTKQSDPRFDGLSKGNLDGAFDQLLKLSDKPMMKVSADRFTERAKLAGFEVVDKTTEKVRIRQVSKLAKGDHKRTISFDANLGAITETSEDAETPEVIQTTIAKLTYAGIPEIPDARIPSTISSISTITLKNKLPPLKLPVAAKVLKDGEELKLKPGEVVVNQFTSPFAVQGTVDVNTATIETTVHVKNLKINTLSLDYFEVGVK